MRETLALNGQRAIVKSVLIKQIILVVPSDLWKSQQLIYRSRGTRVET